MPPIVRADLTAGARYEYIQGTEEELANRLLVKGKLNSTHGPLSLFIEGFGEHETNQDQIFIRRSPPKGYLQEAYFEFKLQSFYLRVGRQALRWSESWTLPSLDIWTGRRWNRLFFDPLNDQLTHPTGITFSYAADNISVDLAAIGELAENIYPMPVPEVELNKNNNFGGRVKWNIGGFGFSALGAQLLKKNYYGLSANYALEAAVPKIEAGYSYDTTDGMLAKRDSSFATAGVDFFVGNWIILPQISHFEVNSLNGGSEFQTSYYISSQWRPDRHDVQLQLFYNPDAEDLFASASYGYNITDSVSATGFMQNYEGREGLYEIYEAITGGFVFGVRLELTGNLVSW